MVEGRYDFYYFSGQNTNVSDFLQKDDELNLCLNFFTSKFGGKKVRPGYTTFLDAIDTHPIRNLVYYNFPNGDKGIIRVSNKNFYKYAFSGSTWGASVLTRTVDATEAYTTLLSLLHFSNGTDDYYTFDGSTFTDGSGANYPKAFTLTSWNSRVYAGNFTNTGSSPNLYGPSRLEYSAVDWTTNYVDPWNSDNNDSATAGETGVDSGNRGNIHAMTVLNDRVTIYKDSGIYRYNGSGILRVPFADSIFPTSVVTSETTGYDYFLSTSGIYKGDGQTVQLASFKIQDIIYDTFLKYGFGNPFSFSYDKHVYFYVGQIYLKSIGETIANGMFVYNELYDEWYIWSLGHAMTCFGYYIDPTTKRKVLISGDANGNTYKWGTEFTSDATIPIAYRMRTKYWDFGSPESTKTFGRYNISTDLGAGGNLAFAIDESDEYKPVDFVSGVLTKNWVKTEDFSDFKTLSIEIQGSTTDSRPEFLGITFKPKEQEERLGGGKAQSSKK